VVATSVLWLASDEWQRWWDPVEVDVVREVPLAGEEAELSLARTRPDGEPVLLETFFGPVRARASSPFSVTAYKVPELWDGEQPLRRAELTFDSEPVVYPSRAEAPVKSLEARERVRKGWAW